MHVQDLARPLALTLAVAIALPAAAQTAPSGAPLDVLPHVIRLEGTGAQVVRDGVATPLEQGDPVLFGDRLDVGQAYGEVLWGDGSRVALDRGASVEALAAELLAVTGGRVLVSRPASASSTLRVDTPAATFLLAPGGEYRFTLDGEVTTLGVVQGRADVQTGMGAQAVEPGQQIAVRDGLAPEGPRRFNGAGFDSFVSWARAPLATPGVGSPLQAFADPRLEAYTDVFNRHGAWNADPQVGAVWYPQVAGDWRPYTDGYWQAYGPESQWLWVGRDPWGWPTHHYGRWGVDPRGRWYWVPGRQWAPSWVSWSVGPGYIGWTPLGAQDQPLWGWDVLSQRRGAYSGGTLDPFRAWTVVPADRFGQRDRLGAYAVDPRTLDNLSAFVSQRVGPPLRPGAPRGGSSATGGYGPGGRDARRYGGSGGATVYGPGGYYGGVRSRTGDDTTGELRQGIGPTRVGPGAPGYGGPTPPPDDPYERAQRAAAPRSRPRTPPSTTPAGAEPSASPSVPAETQARPPAGASRQRTPPREAPQSAPPPAAREAAPAPPPAAEPTPPARDRTPPPAAGRTSGTTTGRRAVPRVNPGG